MIATGKTLDARDKEIVEQISKGKTMQEAARNLHLNYNNVVYRIQEMKKAFSCKSQAHLIKHLNDQGAI